MIETPNCSFVLSVEQGKLEAQAVLLVESLRCFGGVYANSPVYAVSPRSARPMGTACDAALTALGAQTITMDLIPSDEAYGTVARIAACAWAEKNLNSETIISLDDDMFFASEPDFRLNGADFFARPVDVKGMCTFGVGDNFDRYWRKAAQLSGVDYDEIPWIETTVDRISVKASYNGGMVAVRRALGLFQRTQEIFGIMREYDLASYRVSKSEVFSSVGYVGAEATRWWGSAQTAFSMAAIQLKARGVIAPPTYNVPAHLIGNSKWPIPKKMVLKDAVLVHYHWLFDREYIEHSPLLDEDSALPLAVIEWLKSKTPLNENYF